MSSLPHVQYEFSAGDRPSMQRCELLERLYKAGFTLTDRFVEARSNVVDGECREVRGK